MGRRSIVGLLAVLVLSLGMMPLAATPTAVLADSKTPAEPFRYFPETGHNITFEVKQFYDERGGLEIFGMPLTEVISENGQSVQYFERARFEIHPENKGTPYYILPSRLGAYFTQGRENEEPFQWRVEAPDPSLEFFKESGHSLGHGFRDFWYQHGGVKTFGYPISEEFQEVSTTDGQTYTVQYFERARFEWHPENAGTKWEIQLGLLGSNYIRSIGLDPKYLAPVAGIVKLGSATTHYYGSAAERVNNIARAAARFNGVTVKSGQVFSFIDNVGDISADSGFSDGYAIVGGRLERVIGGGLCQVSTTMYRAVFNAGLPIVERYGHTYIVNYYENILGFDATVFTPDVDFRWKNDLPTDILITTETIPSDGSVTFNLWGYSDGRTSAMEGPYVSNRRNPGADVWQYDKTLGYGAVVQMVHGRPGMDVTMYRVITKANGATARERFFTRYLPWEDFYLYGPGVTPPASATVIAPRYP